MNQISTLGSKVILLSKAKDRLIKVQILSSQKIGRPSKMVIWRPFLRQFIYVYLFGVTSKELQLCQSAFFGLFTIFSAFCSFLGSVISFLHFELFFKFQWNTFPGPQLGTPHRCQNCGISEWLLVLELRSWRGQAGMFNSKKLESSNGWHFRALKEMD